MMQFTYKSNKVQTLTDEEVYKQIASGNTNKTKLKKQHDYMNIVFRNVFTFFNILLFAIFIVLIICQRYFQTFFFYLQREVRENNFVKLLPHLIEPLQSTFQIF